MAGAQAWYSSAAPLGRVQLHPASRCLFRLQGALRPGRFRQTSHPRRRLLGHLRSDFFDVHTATKSEIAHEALDRIGDLYDIERQINGQPRDARLSMRQAETCPKVEAFKAWSEAQLARIPGKSDLAKAFRYALNRWDAFILFPDDGRVAIDNNAAERATKPIVIGRKNSLAAGTDPGGRNPR
jgi:transposase